MIRYKVKNKLIYFKINIFIKTLILGILVYSKGFASIVYLFTSFTPLY